MSRPLRTASQMIAALLSDATACERLQSALTRSCSIGATYRLYFAESSQDLLRISQRPLTLVVLDPYVTGRFDGDLIAKVNAEIHPAAQIAYGRFQNDRIDDLVTVMKIGVADVILRDYSDSAEQIRATVGEALANCEYERLIKLLPEMPDRLLDLVKKLLNSQNNLVPSEAAKKLYFSHPNTLRKHLKDIGFPSINRLIVWTRLFKAAILMQDAQRSISSVARALGYPSEAAFRNQLYRYCQVRPAGLRTPEAVDIIAKIFQQRIADQLPPRPGHGSQRRN